MNIIDALNIFYREDVISDLLKSCFDDSEQFLRQFLKGANIALPMETKFTVQNRVGLGRNIGTPDMVIVGQNENDSYIIIIENKLGATEGNEQTDRYVSDQAKLMIAQRLNLMNPKFYFIYLTLDTTVTPRNSAFIPMYYKMFLQQDWILSDVSLNQIFTDFREKLKGFYEPLEQPKQALLSHIPLDSTQKMICWQSILFAEINTMQQFDLDWGPVGGSGRKNFLFRLEKQEWQSEKKYTESGLANTYRVHIDTFVNLLSNKSDYINEISVRFETNPYIRHKDICKDEGYEEFIRNKGLFAEYLNQKLLSHKIGAKKRNHKLQILTIPINNTDLDLSIADYKSKVVILEKAIDQAMKELLIKK